MSNASTSVYRKKITTVCKLLRILFSPYLLILVLSPIVVGFIINYETSKMFWVPVNLIWILPFSLLFALINKKIIYQLTVIFYYLIGVIEIGHWIIIGGPLRVNSILVIANTNLEETVGFFDLQSTSGLLFLIPYTLVFILALINSPKVEETKHLKYSLLALSLVFIVFLGFAATSKNKHQYIPRIASTMYIFSTQWSNYQKALEGRELKPVDAIPTIKKAQVFVLILGESSSRNHMSLYGSKVKSTPLLDTREDIIVFRDVISGYSLTRESVPSMLSQSNLENQLDSYEGIDLLDVFHSAGFRTYWLSNQSPLGIFDNIVGTYANKCDFVKYVDAEVGAPLQTFLNTSYDFSLMEPFTKALEEDYEKKFIVLHLMGTHAAYKKRYPPEFDVFKGATSREQTIAEYHNSMLYNDFIIDSLLNTLKAKTALLEQAVVSAIYVSDHGENLYDESDRVGHSYADQIPKVNLEIPFFVWLSQNYVETDPLKASIIASGTDRPYVTDDLFHSILDLNHIQSHLLEDERSIFSENFNHTRKRIVADGMDYDKK